MVKSVVFSNIRVEKDVKDALLIFKVTNGFKTINDAIVYLLGKVKNV
jgi:hypothetical protein